MPRSKHILWVDDEIGHLSAHISFLKDRGYDIATATNGDDAIKLVGEIRYDVILLDQMMVGRDGLSTLEALQQIDPNLPVIMITKSSEEVLMDQAFRGNINDFLVKPVSPSQILAALKGILDREELSRRHRADEFTKFIRAAYNELEDNPDLEKLIGLYLEFARWNVSLEGLMDEGLQSLNDEILAQANHLFSETIVRNYPQWVSSSPANRPTLSNDVLRHYVLPDLLRDKVPTVLVVIDGMRYDQWLAIKPLFMKDWSLDEKHYLACLPSSTNYSRNALFSGMFPNEIARQDPAKWSEADKEMESLNRYEEYFFNRLIREKTSAIAQYFKLANAGDEASFRKRIPQIASRGGITALVVNFIDTLTHERARQDIIEVITPDDVAFRRLIRTYIQSSSVMEYVNLLRKEQPNVRLVITSDHGSTPTNRAVVAYGDKHTTKSLRYWFGRDLRFDAPGAVLIKQPHTWGLPEEYIGKSYLIALEDFHFAFSFHLHENKRRYGGIYQHGGISLAEMVLPLAILTPR